MSNQENNIYEYALFISYSHKDAEFVDKICSELKILGKKVWRDEKVINVGDSVVSSIRKGIDSSRYFAIVVSENSINSRWVEREADIATNIELKEGRTIVLPILLQGTNLPGFLEGKLYADFRSSHSEGLSELAKALAPERNIFFEVTETVDNLYLNDPTGSRAILEKEWNISVIRGELTQWFYCLQGSTENFELIETIPNILAKQSKCHIKHSFNFTFQKPLVKGEQINFKAKILAKGAYLSNEEWWSVHKPSQSCSDCIVTQGVVKLHTVKVIFPESRPFKSYRGELIKGSQALSPTNKVIASKENNRKILTWIIDREFDHTLWWNW